MPRDRVAGGAAPQLLADRHPECNGDLDAFIDADNGSDCGTSVN